MHTPKFTVSFSAATALRYVALVLLFSALPTWATFPGRNGKIVFSSNTNGSWQLYTINPDGTDMVQITNLPPTGGVNQPGLGQPAFSPDGTRIVFSYGPFDNNGNPLPDLYVINVDGTGLTRLTNDARSSSPRWSPDGTMIVFARTSTRTGANTIVTMHADGTGAPVTLTSDIWDSYGPVYTPDGRHIVNYSQNGGFVAAVWTMHANGANQMRLTPAPLEGFPSDVSPNEQHILLGNHGNSPFVLSNDIFVMNVDGTDLKRLTHLARTHHDIDAGYSPDGKRIVFASDRLSSDASLDLFTMNPDGSHIERIATGLTVGGCPSDNCLTPNWGPKP
jgi:Tol biopolymer transport system component